MSKFDHILHRADGVTTVELNSQIGTFRAVTSEKLIAARQDVWSAELTLISSEAFTVNVGDWIQAKDIRLYCMSTIDRYTCSEDNNREYQLTFYDPAYYFRQAVFYNTYEIEDGGFYSYSRVDNTYPSVGTFEDFVKLCCYNCNSVQGERLFRVGTINEDIATDIRVLTFSDYNCLAVLKQTCEDFETTWRVRINEDPEPDSVFIIDFGVEIEDFPVTLRVEKGQGLTNIEVTGSDKDVYTQFVIKGGTENLPADYPYPNLQLDEDPESAPPILANSTIKLPELYARWGKSVKELTYDIKPSRTGTVSSISEDILKFVDSDLIGVEWSPVGGTIHFVSGHLIGFTFNCKDFNPATGLVTIESTEENNGFVLPSPTESYYRINEGDKYNVAGIPLPEHYVTQAKAKLKERSFLGIGYWSQFRMQYAIGIDPSIINVEIIPNMGFHIVHPALGIDKIIRAQQVIYDLSKEFPYDIESLTVSDLATDDSKADTTHRQIATTRSIVNGTGASNVYEAKMISRQRLLDDYAKSQNLPNWAAFMDILNSGKGLWQDEDGEWWLNVGAIKAGAITADMINVTDLVASEAFVGRLLANEVFIAGLPDVSVPENALLVDENGMIDFTATTSGGAPGLYVDSAKLGYWDGTAWKTYLANNGDFYLAGATADNYLTWISSTNTLTVKGAIHALSGSIGGLTIAADKVYLGDGVYGGATTPFYVDDDGQMSLKDKFKWDGTNLTINGGGTFTGSVSIGDILIGKDAYGSGLHGIKLNAYNYWYLEGANAKFMIGGESSYIEWNSTTLTQNGAAFNSGSIVGSSIDIPNATTPLFKVTSAGVITAKRGTIGGVSFTDTKLYLGTGTYGNSNTGFYVDTSAKFSLKEKLKFDGTNLTINGGGTFSGALSAASGTFAGSLSAASGTFAGSLSAASGTFAGSLSAASGTFAGTVEVGTLKIGDSVSGGNDGIYMDSYNYWLLGGDFIVGSSTKNLFFDQSANTLTFTGALSGATGTFNGVYAGTIEVGSTLKIGADAGGTGDFGIYIDSVNYWLESGFSVGVSGSRLYLDGSILKFTGSLSAATGTFAGSLSAASGTFGGLIDAGGVKIGLAAGGAGVDGIYIDANNYWYDTGSIKIGGATKYITYSSGNLSMVGGSFSASDGTTTVNVSSSAAGSAGISVVKGSAFAQIGLSGDWPSVFLRSGGAGQPSVLLTPGQVTVGDSVYATLEKGQLSLSGLVFNTTNLGTGNVVKTAGGGFLRFGTSKDNEDASHTHQYINGYKIVVGTGSSTDTIYFSTT